MVKEYVKELGGSTLKAYDNDRNPVDIVLVEANRKFKNKSGKNVPVLRDMTNYLANEVKQEAIALIDELVLASNYNGKEPARHPHDWVDNNGANDWDVWTTYIKDKKNTVWEATLRIANSANGEKILYDIFPIKKVEGVQTMDIATTEDSVPQNGNGVNPQNTKITDAQNEKGLDHEQEVTGYNRRCCQQVHTKVKPRPDGRGLMFALPIFPGSRPPSIVGANELNFCVRDGNRWTLIAINTNSYGWLLTIFYIQSFSAVNLVTHTGFEPMLTA